MNSIKDLKYTRIVITGDFNLNLLNINEHEPTAMFLHNMMSNGLLPNITSPTRVSATSAALTDNIFSST